MSYLNISTAPASAGQRQASLQRTLLTLLDSGHPVAGIELDALSDLDRNQQEQLRATWAGLSGERRRELVTALVEFAEDHIDADFRGHLPLAAGGRRCLDPGAGHRRAVGE
ncbi:MAG: hypothetical protein V9H69_09765 [Anaerolineae bacterium]